MAIPHSKPSIHAADLAAVSAVLKSGHLAQGRKVEAFERELGRYIGVKAGVAVNSGTSALHLSLLALGVGTGDEVIIPSYVCSALLNAVLYTGATPKIADVGLDHFNITMESARRQLTKKTKALIVPHMFGQAADMKALAALDVPVIEDCAQSLGAAYGGRKAGSFGVLSVCSFYATKLLTTGEGGMILSNNTKLLDKVRDLREYDSPVDSKVRYNYKMTDLQAALGSSQLARLPAFIARRKKIAAAYDQAFKGSGVTVPYKAAGQDHIYYRYVVKVSPGQKAFLKKLHNKGVDVSIPVFKPLHHYVKTAECPAADKLMAQAVSIPVYPDLSDAQVQYIIKNAI